MQALYRADRRVDQPAADVGNNWFFVDRFATIALHKTLQAAPQMDSAFLVGDVVDELLKAFRREPGGTWICVEPTTFEGPNGRIQVARGTAFTPGSMFMGADLAKWLDERLAKLHNPTSH